MNLELNDEQRMIAQTVRRFIREEIAPLEQELDPDAASLPPVQRGGLVEKVKQMGLWCLDAPIDVGGPGLDVVTRCLAAEEMSQHRAGLDAPAYGVFNLVGSLIQLCAGTQDQKERYLHPLMRGEMRGFFGLTEPSGGSDPARAIQTRATKDNGVWVINGTKTFISGAYGADFGLIFARTDPKAGRAGITCFIVESNTPGFTIRRVIQTLSAAAGTCEISLDNVQVPDSNILGEVGRGFAVANATLSCLRLPYASASIGVAVASQRMSIDWARTRETFGQRLSTRQAIQWMIVDNEIDVRTSRWLYLDGAYKADRGAPFRFEAAMAKLHCTEAASRVLDRAIQIHGGYGVAKDLPLERWWRELRIRRIGEGSSEIQRLIMARDLLSGES